MSYYSEVLADTPLAYYHLDETSGSTFADASGNGRTASLHGTGHTLGVSGGLAAGGNAMQVNGNGGLRIPHDSGMDTSYFTLELLVKVTSYPTNYSYIFNKFTSGAHAIRRHSPSSWNAFAGTSGGFVGAADISRPSDGVWHHVALAWDGGALRLYYDGTQVYAPTGSGTANTDANDWNVGGPGWDGNGINGFIDEPAYYGYALSAGRIAAHAAAVSALPPATRRFTSDTPRARQAIIRAAHL